MLYKYQEPPEGIYLYAYFMSVFDYIDKVNSVAEMLPIVEFQNIALQVLLIQFFHLWPSLEKENS